MVQISDLGNFYCFSFHCWRQCSFLNCNAQICRTVGATDCFYGFVYRVTNPPVYDFADFLNDNLAKMLALRWRG